MALKKKSIVETSDKLNHSTNVLLKRWAGLSGLYGYKDMGLEEVVALFESNGWKVVIDDSASPNRTVELYKEEKRVRKEKFVVDEAGRVRMV
ncbi:hypothetical protein SAMN02799630_00331 [Paenibacillus sp. UNCCL117]|uniref:hypothetical protein n=1 Tax=unclassified Paenibacillus TaxID=185978 RepID=UPI00088321EE|nr:MULTISPECIES: hypothetical protein [unclassified Paenibacillus]SDC43769.1 hypothetical protein SAMN04488602_102201 [Paenibacillus sp. cl123]SFW12883.1 hypothetical protein SAMN02799630_00331 [Paenibacillus sp. UNCCL117]